MEALGLNLPMLIAQIVGFLVLLYILSKLLYRPLLKVMDERADRIKGEPRSGGAREGAGCCQPGADAGRHAEGA